MHTVTILGGDIYSRLLAHVLPDLGFSCTLVAGPNRYLMLRLMKLYLLGSKGLFPIP